MGADWSHGIQSAEDPKSLEQAQDARGSVLPVLQREANAAVRLLEETAGPRQIEERRASPFRLQGQDAQVPAEDSIIR